MNSVPLPPLQLTALGKVTAVSLATFVTLVTVAPLLIGFYVFDLKWLAFLSPILFLSPSEMLSVVCPPAAVYSLIAG